LAFPDGFAELTHAWSRQSPSDRNSVICISSWAIWISSLASVDGRMGSCANLIDSIMHHAPMNASILHTNFNLD